MEWRPAGWSVCLPLSIFPCTVQSRSSLLALAHLGGPGKRAVNRLWCVVAVYKHAMSHSMRTEDMTVEVRYVRRWVSVVCFSFHWMIAAVWAVMRVWGWEWRLSELFCVVLSTTVVINTRTRRVSSCRRRRQTWLIDCEELLNVISQHWTAVNAWLWLWRVQEAADRLCSWLPCQSWRPSCN